MVLLALLLLQIAFVCRRFIQSSFVRSFVEFNTASSLPEKHICIQRANRALQRGSASWQLYNFSQPSSNEASQVTTLRVCAHLNNNNNKHNKHNCNNSVACKQRALRFALLANWLSAVYSLCLLLRKSKDKQKNEEREKCSQQSKTERNQLTQSCNNCRGFALRCFRLSLSFGLCLLLAWMAFGSIMTMRKTVARNAFCLPSARNQNKAAAWN